MTRRALILAALVNVAACDAWANHPLAFAGAVGGAMMAGGVALAADHHPLAGGTLIGLSVGAFAIMIPLGVIIDNYNASHSGPH